MSLKELAANGHIRTHTTSRNEINGLRELIERDLRDASIEALSDDRRFATAYNAALQISKMILACSGYRVAKGAGAHFNSFEAARFAIPTPEVELLSDYLDTCRRKRNHIDYDGSEVVTRTETEEIIRKANKYKEIASEWIKKNYPDLA